MTTDTARGARSGPFTIYLRIRRTGWYVGKSDNPARRLGEHRRTVGPLTYSHVLMHSIESEELALWHEHRLIYLIGALCRTNHVAFENRRKLGPPPLPGPTCWGTPPQETPLCTTLVQMALACLGPRP